jgi:hypothetical protein
MNRNDEFIENATMILCHLCHNSKALEITPFALVQQSFAISRELMDAVDNIEVESRESYR